MPTASRQNEPRTGEHVVHFYRDIAELADVVGAYLGGGLVGGAVAIVIATEAHVSAFEQELMSAGVDLASARANGAWQVLDAAETLESLKVRGRVDREAFRRVVGTLVASTGESGRDVRAYGEMVDLLWRDGDLEGAIELEKLWNELLCEQEFGLLCAYRSEAVLAPERGAALRKVCGLHTAREVSRRFSFNDDAPRAARRFVDETIECWGHADGVADDARLVVSELVTNAVTHACSPLQVSIASQAAKLRLAVADESPAEPDLQPEAVDAESGRGLQIVAALSRSWGVEVTPQGKTVWAEL